MVNIFTKSYIDILGGNHINKQRLAQEYKKCVGGIATKRIVQRMKKYMHHGKTSCFKHSVHVSYYNYIICKKLGLDYYAAAKAGLLHDLFLYDWHNYVRGCGEQRHGFEHPRKALRNARSSFTITSKEADIIEKHMFPLTLWLPKYKETCVIVITDKFCSVCEFIDGLLGV